MVERALVGLILSDPTKYQAVSLLRPEMFHDPLCREIWRIITAKEGAIALPVIIDQLNALPELRSQLADDPQLVGLIQEGLGAGDPVLLAERITATYIRRRVRQIFADAYHYEDPDILSWTRRLADAITNVSSILTTNHRGQLHASAEAVAQDIFWRQRHPDMIRGLRTNFGAHPGKTGTFDRATDGLHPGELTIITGQTGGGKSMVLCAMALGLAQTPRDWDQQRNHVAFFSLEMNERALAKRWIAAITKLPLDVKKLPDNARERIVEAVRILTEMETQGYLTVIPPGQSATVEQIIQHLRRLKADGKLDVAFIDYAQIIRTAAQSAVGRYEQLGYISMLLKTEAESLGIPIVMAAQLTRPDRDMGWRPTIADIADSYALARNADNVHHIWFPGDQLGSNAGIWRDVAVLLTDKIRNRERPRQIYYHAERALCQFEECLPQVVAQLESEEVQDILRDRIRRVGTR